MILKEIRKAEGLTQKQVAERSQISEAAICLIENGKRNPSLKTAQRIAAVLGVTVNDLIQNEMPEQEVS